MLCFLCDKLCECDCLQNCLHVASVVVCDTIISLPLGICNFGKLNYYLGERAKTEGRDSAYPDVNFCKDPESVCASTEHPELKWISGLFYWTESVQSYTSEDKVITA